MATNISCVPDDKRDINTKIYKYELPIEDCVEIDMLQHSKILCVQTQANKICIWALVGVTRVTRVTKRKFFVVGTGHALPIDAHHYLGTVQLDNGSLVYHIYEAY